MANYYVLLTDHGKSFIANAQASNQLALTHVVLGDANGQPYLPDSRLTQTTLVHQTAKLPVASVKVINANTAEVSTVVPSNVGGFNLHEVGITDSSGKLVYIGNFHGGYRPTLTEGAGGDMELIFTITANNLATVIIETDGTVVTATRDWVTEKFTSKVDFEGHLNALDPHSQYLNNNRFQMLAQMLVPIGYLYHSHLPINPKSLFDELLGIDTYWRRIVGRMMIATDSNNPFISDIGITVGQKGLTTAAGTAQPHIYPLQTTHIYERYDPDYTPEVQWIISANKTEVGDGTSVVFTVSGINVPDGQQIRWEVSEGELDATSEAVVEAESNNEASGTTYLAGGRVDIKYQSAVGVPLLTPRHIVFKALSPFTDVLVLPVVENLVVEKLNFWINSVSQTVKKGTRTLETQVFALANVSESTLVPVEFAGDGRRFHTFEELDSIDGNVSEITDMVSLHHIWIKVQEEYTDETLYTITVNTPTRPNYFNYSIIKDTAYDGLFKTNTNIGEQANRYWLQLRMVIKPPLRNADMPSNMPVNINVLRKT